MRTLREQESSELSADLDVRKGQVVRRAVELADGHDVVRAAA